MPLTLRVKGVEDFGRVAKKLKAAGEEGKGLRRELLKGINRETKPLRQAAKANARRTLPKRGGLARLVARASMTTKTRLSGASASVRIVAKKAEHIARIDKGTVRHPVFGNRKLWVSQSVAPGWFTKPMQEGSSKVRTAILQAVRNTAKKI